MIPSPETSEKKPRPILYGVLAVGAFAAIVITGWVMLSPSALESLREALTVVVPPEKPLSADQTLPYVSV